MATTSTRKSPRSQGTKSGGKEMAPAYVFFASNADSSFVSGEVHALLGGETTAG